jgi:hypothetical protein
MEYCGGLLELAGRVEERRLEGDALGGGTMRSSSWRIKQWKIDARDCRLCNS